MKKHKIPHKNKQCLINSKPRQSLDFSEQIKLEANRFAKQRNELIKTVNEVSRQLFSNTSI